MCLTENLHLPAIDRPICWLMDGLNQFCIEMIFQFNCCKFGKNSQRGGKDEEHFDNFIQIRNVGNKLYHAAGIEGQHPKEEYVIEIETMQQAKTFRNRIWEFPQSQQTKNIRLFFVEYFQ